MGMERPLRRATEIAGIKGYLTGGLAPDTKRQSELAYWLKQELNHDKPESKANRFPPLIDADTDRMPGGWWLVPAAAISMVMWYYVIVAIFG